QNTSRQPPPGGDFLVLLLRAELLRRYPNVVVYAVQAQWNASGGHDLAPNAQEVKPEFQGTLATGVGFWGFRLTADAARGGTQPATDPPGYFFALQEHPSEPRFGLESAAAGTFGGTASSWDKLSWADLANDAN